MYLVRMLGAFLAVLVTSVLVAAKMESDVHGSWYLIFTPLFFLAALLILMAVQNLVRNVSDGTMSALALAFVTALRAYNRVDDAGSAEANERAHRRRKVLDRAEALEAEKREILRDGAPMLRFDEDFGEETVHRPVLRYFFLGLYLALQVALLAAALEGHFHSRHTDTYLLVFVPTFVVLVLAVLHVSYRLFQVVTLHDRLEANVRGLEFLEDTDRRHSGASHTEQSSRPGSKAWRSVSRQRSGGKKARRPPAPVAVFRGEDDVEEEEDGDLEAEFEGAEIEKFEERNLEDLRANFPGKDLDSPSTRAGLKVSTLSDMVRAHTVKVRYAFELFFLVLILVFALLTAYNASLSPRHRWSEWSISALLWVDAAAWLGYLIYATILRWEGMLGFEFPIEEQLLQWANLLLFVSFSVLAVARSESRDVSAYVVFVPFYAWFFVALVLRLVRFGRYVYRASLRSNPPLASLAEDPIV